MVDKINNQRPNHNKSWWSQLESERPKFNFSARQPMKTIYLPQNHQKISWHSLWTFRACLFKKRIFSPWQNRLREWSLINLAMAQTINNNNNSRCLFHLLRMLGVSRQIRIILFQLRQSEDVPKLRSPFPAQTNYPWSREINNAVKTRTTYLRTEIRWFMKCIHLNQRITPILLIIIRISERFQISKPNIILIIILAWTNTSMKQRRGLNVLENKKRKLKYHLAHAWCPRKNVLPH